MALSRFVLPYVDVGAGIRPSSGAKLFFYATGTSTPKNTFADSTGSTANANPVIANANGVFPAIFLDGIFNVALKDANDVQIWTADPVSTEASGNGTFSGVTISDDYATLKMLSTADASGFNETWLVESNNNLDLQHRNGSGGYLANLIRLDLKTTSGGGLNLMTIYGPALFEDNITLGSGKTVDGREVSVDGVKLDTLSAPITAAANHIRLGREYLIDGTIITSTSNVAATATAGTFRTYGKTGASTVLSSMNAYVPAGATGVILDVEIIVTAQSGNNATVSFHACNADLSPSVSDANKVGFGNAYESSAPSGTFTQSGAMTRITVPLNSSGIFKASFLQTLSYDRSCEIYYRGYVTD